MSETVQGRYIVTMEEQDLICSLLNDAISNDLTLTILNNPIFDILYRLSYLGSGLRTCDRDFRVRR